jgi:hypothetical protein
MKEEMGYKRSMAHFDKEFYHHMPGKTYQPRFIPGVNTRLVLYW